MIKKINSSILPYWRVKQLKSNWRTCQILPQAIFQEMRISFCLICLICLHRKTRGLFMNNLETDLFFWMQMKKLSFSKTVIPLHFPLLSGRAGGRSGQRQPVFPNENKVVKFSVSLWLPFPTGKIWLGICCQNQK